MKSLIKLLFVTILLTLTIKLSAQNATSNKAKIEIYLINKFSKSDSIQPKSNYFFPTKESLSDTPFIRNEEIIGYRIYNDNREQKLVKSYSILLSSAGQEKINGIENIPLCCGRKFAIVLNGNPIFGAYFWCIYSSFGCTWLTTVNFRDRELRLEKGLPDKYFDGTKKDPRDDETLINAFSSSGRLITK